ncbi:MAG: nucleoside deaminase [Lachnospiraceae bacterium]|nr:nucleoside deaminase [Lachnospiraceae bacterium]
MRFSELSRPWQRVFELDWLSLCEGSKAIGAVIVDEKGEIISEGRNRIYEDVIPNPAVWHAEVEAVRNLDVRKFPNLRSYTLYAGLEPCPMCMGTLVMGHIRHVVIGAPDNYGGAMGLMKHSPFLARKNVQVTFEKEEYGHMQRAFQTLWELIYHGKDEKTEAKLLDFSVYNKIGVEAAKKLLEDGVLEGRVLSEVTVEEVFDALAKRF